MSHDVCAIQFDCSLIKNMEAVTTTASQLGMKSHNTFTTMPKVSIKIIDENMIECNQNVEQHFAKENLEFPDCECVFQYAQERPEVIFPNHGR